MRPGRESNWVDRLLRLAEGPDAGRRITFLTGEGDVASSTSYYDLSRRARAVGSALRDEAGPGERAILLTDQSPAFIEGFLGCAFAGMPAVPAFPLVGGPADARVAAMVRDAAPAVAVTTLADRDAMRERLAAHVDIGRLRWLAVDGVDDGRADDREPTTVVGDSLLLLQYTSGSTAEPKGVMVTHADAALHNQAAIAEAMGLDRSFRVIGWLPLHHSAGLVSLLLQPLFLGAECEILAPETFLGRPLAWLERISRSEERCTAGGPNFAYEHCLREVGPARREGLDLGRWAVAFTGSEPVRAATLRRFAREFAPCGFRPSAFTPCYGIAEATSMVTSAAVGRGPTVRRFRSADLLRNLAIPTPDPEGLELVGNGPAWGGQDVVVVDPETARALPDGRAGEVWVRGPAVSPGYWGRPDATRETYGGRLVVGDETDPAHFLRTGDLGFWLDGELYLTGRLKDVVIIRGENHSPIDIEQTALGSDPRLAPGAAAAVAIEDEGGGGERLAVVLELADGVPADDRAEVASAVRRAVAERHGLSIEVVALLARGTLPRTPTRKIPRQVIRRRLQLGELEPLLVSHASGPSAPDPATGGDAVDRPAGSIAEGVRSLAARAIRVPEAGLDPDRPLTDYGLDSLLAVELASRIERCWGAVLSPTDLLRGLSSSALAARVEAALRDGPDAAPPSPPPDLRRDATFDDEIHDRGDGPALFPPTSIFLTGATGFVGAFLLRALLRRTGATVRCLVRSPGRAEAVERLLSNASAYGIGLGPWRGRIVPVLGDLAEPRMGLDPGDWDALADEVDAVFHNGALVNFLQPYEALRAANVEGTRDVLRLASRGRAKAVHLVSSIAVVPFRARAGSAPVREDDPLDDGEALTSGYAQTKWVADAMARHAARRGLSVRVYRLGVITGDSRTGLCNTRDFMACLLKSFAEFGIAPADVPLPVDMTPVDAAAEALVAIALDPDNRDRVFHVVNPEPVQIRTINDAIRRLGYPLRELPFADWVAEVGVRCRRDSSAALFPYLSTLEDLRLPRPGPRLDVRNLLRGLEGQGIAFPTIDDSLLGTYWNAFIEAGFVPPPPDLRAGRDGARLALSNDEGRQ